MERAGPLAGKRASLSLPALAVMAHIVGLPCCRRNHATTAEKVTAKDDGHKKSPGAIFNVASATARRVIARDGDHKKRGIRI